VQLRWYLLDCAAWAALSLAAQAAYLQVARLYDGSNNGRLVLGVRTLAERLGHSKSAAARALNELEEKGFIGVQKVGLFRRKRISTEYFMTDHRNDVTLDLPTRAFLRWRPGLNLREPSDRIVPFPASHSPTGGT
jgi:hypothetical protein